MQEVRDKLGHLVCKVDKCTGAIEAVYRGQIVSTIIQVGGCVRIKRGGAVTDIVRTGNKKYEVSKRIE